MHQSFWMDVRNILHLFFHTQGDVIDLGKSLTDLHKGFVLGLGEDDDDVDGDEDTNEEKDQESIVLKRLLKNIQKHG